MRLFAALVPPAAALAHLAAAVAQAVSGAGSAVPLRWVPAEQRHLTLAFYGEVPDARVPDLSARLERAAGRSAPAQLALAGAGTFPGRRTNARVLWVGLVGELAELTRLAERAVAAGRRAGLALEDRPFRAHLTLARARTGPADLSVPVAALSGYRGPDWAAESISLVRSYLGATARHEELARFSLGPAGVRGRPSNP